MKIHQVVIIIGLLFIFIMIGYSIDGKVSKRLDEKAELIKYITGLEVTPEQAKHIQIVCNLTNVQLSIDQFTVLEK